MTITSENRIQADRMWRNPKLRVAFERETATREGDSDYDARFNEWAAGVISRREECPKAALSGPGGGCHYPECEMTCHGRTALTTVDRG